MGSAESDGRLAVLVYGTLRPGGGNHARLLAGTTIGEQPARLPGAVMHEGPGFPYVVDGDGTVTGCIVDLDPDRYEQVMAQLDRLEGYQPDGRANHYNRVVRTVHTAAGPQRAWVYLAAHTPTGPVIDIGDWFDRHGAAVGVR